MRPEQKLLLYGTAVTIALGGCIDNGPEPTPTPPSPDEIGWPSGEALGSGCDVYNTEFSEEDLATIQTMQDLYTRNGIPFPHNDSILKNGVYPERSGGDVIEINQLQREFARTQVIDHALESTVAIGVALFGSQTALSTQVRSVEVLEDVEGEGGAYVSVNELGTGGWASEIYVYDSMIRDNDPRHNLIWELHENLHVLDFANFDSNVPVGMRVCREHIKAELIDHFGGPTTIFVNEYMDRYQLTDPEKNPFYVLGEQLYLNEDFREYVENESDFDGVLSYLGSIDNYIELHGGVSREHYRFLGELTIQTRAEHDTVFPDDLEELTNQATNRLVVESFAEIASLVLVDSANGGTYDDPEALQLVVDYINTFRPPTYRITDIESFLSLFKVENYPILPDIVARVSEPPVSDDTGSELTIESEREETELDSSPGLISVEYPDFDDLDTVYTNDVLPYAVALDGLFGENASNIFYNLYPTYGFGYEEPDGNLPYLVRTELYDIGFTRRAMISRIVQGIRSDNENIEHLDNSERLTTIAEEMVALGGGADQVLSLNYPAGIMLDADNTSADILEEERDEYAFMYMMSSILAADGIYASNPDLNRLVVEYLVILKDEEGTSETFQLLKSDNRWITDQLNYIQWTVLRDRVYNATLYQNNVPIEQP